MPRSHGRILSAIWNDEDFIALPTSPQRLYLFLLSQPDLSHAGLMPMRIRRWAKKAPDATPETVQADLARLERDGFIVVDEDTEEVLIRTFVRNDGVYKQPKVMLRMREDAQQIESGKLRAAFRVELDRLPLDELSTNPGGRNGDQPSTYEAVSAVVDTLRSDFVDAQEYPSERVSDTPRVGAGAFPRPPAPVPQPPSPVPATPGADAPRAELAVIEAEPNAQILVAEWIDHCTDRPPGNVVGQVAKQIKTMLDEGIPVERIRPALAEWNRKGLHPSTLPSVVHEVANRRPAPRKGDIDWEAAFARAAARDAENGAHQ